LVAAFATRGLCADVFRVVVTEHDLVLGTVILDELRRVLQTKLKLPPDRLGAIEAALAPFEVIPKPARPSPFPVRDRSDRWILATGVAGNADVLVTGDDDLLDVAAAAPVRIMDPRAFWSLLRRA